MNFYDGGKITRGSTGEATLVDNNGHSTQLTKMKQTSATMTMMFEHYQQCLQHCQMLENVLSNLDTRGDCFPVIVGRRPSSAPVLGPVRDQNVNVLTPRGFNV